MVRIHDRPSWLRRTRARLDAVAEVIDQRRLARRSREEVIARRDERVRSTVMFASSSVPWYREALAAAGVDAREIRHAGDLSLLPVVERSQLQSAPRAFRGSGEQGGLLLSTTGSTATPLEVLHDRAPMIASIAHAERTRTVEASFVGRRYRYRVRGYYARELFRPLRPKGHRLSVATPLEKSSRRSKQFGPMSSAATALSPNSSFARQRRAAACATGRVWWCTPVTR